MSKKLAVISFFVLITAGMVFAQPVDTGDQVPENGAVNKSPSISTPGQGLSGSIGNATQGFLPEQASDTARNVVNIVFDTPSESIGNALQSLFGAGGGGDSVNSTNESG